MSSATIRDVAKHAGVGVGTVSRVINGSSSVREPTRQKVLAAIRALDYTPNQSARRLSLGKTLTIGVIVPYFTNPSVVERLRGIESVLADSNYDMILFNVETIERRDAYFQDLPRRERVDGLLIISILLDDLDAERFRHARVPTVLIDSYHPHFTCVYVDNVIGGYQATQHLIDLGHRQIGYVSDFPENPFNFLPTQERHAGYQQALSKAGIPYRPEYYRQGALGRSEARRLAHELLSLPDPPTAIFAYSDTQAIGVMEATKERGQNIPHDLSVIGFDNIELSELLNLTTVRQSLFTSGVQGSRLLLDLLEGKDTTVKHIKLPTGVILRSTTTSIKR